MERAVTEHCAEQGRTQFGRTDPRAARSACAADVNHRDRRSQSGRFKERFRRALRHHSSQCLQAPQRDGERPRAQPIGQIGVNRINDQRL